MTVYSGPVFDMAAKQFAIIADHLSIPLDERDRLLLPKRAVTVPVRSAAMTAASSCSRAIGCSIC